MGSSPSALLRPLIGVREPYRRPAGIAATAARAAVSRGGGGPVAKPSVALCVFAFARWESFYVLRSSGQPASKLWWNPASSDKYSFSRSAFYREMNAVGLAEPASSHSSSVAPLSGIQEPHRAGPPAPQADAPCSASAGQTARRRKRAAQTKRHFNVFLKHKMKYTKKSSTQEDSSSSTESERATPIAEALQVSFLPGAMTVRCEDGLHQAAGGFEPPAPTDDVPLQMASSAQRGPVGREPAVAFFKSIPSASSSLSSTSSSSSGASAEKEGSDSSDSLASATATRRKNLKKASVEKEGSDSSDSPASGASVSRRSIKKLIRNKYDIFRRHKLKYRHLLGKIDVRSDTLQNYDVENNAVHANTSVPAGGSGYGGDTRSSSSSSSAAAGTAACHAGTAVGPRSLPHNGLLHSSSSNSRSSSSMQSSSSGSRDGGFVDKGRDRRPSPSIINRVVPLMVMVQRQVVEGDTSSAALMFKCNMCNMFSSMMRSVLTHINERHATAQYCFECESFFPDQHSLDSHRAVGCQGGCSVSRAGSDNQACEGRESPLSAICVKDTGRPETRSYASQDAGSSASDLGESRCRDATLFGTDVERRCDVALSSRSAASLDSLISPPPPMSAALMSSDSLPSIADGGGCNDSNREYRCRLCSKEFLGSCYLKRHMRSHTGEKICFCPTCHRGFSEWRNLRNHIARFHGGRPMPTLGSAGSDNGCGASAISASTSAGSVSEGMAVPNGTPLSLSASFVLEEGNSADAACLAAEHENQRLLICCPPLINESEADKMQESECDPLQHTTMHLGSTSSRLEIKNDETFRQQSLTPHDCAGGLRRTYHCEPCNKDFVTKFAMQRHLDFHADKRPFHCDMCSYKSKTKPQLKVHQMRHKGQKGYHCDLCNYDCVTHSDLNRHCKSMSHKSRHSSSLLSS